MTDTTKTYLWCDLCKRSYRHADAPEDNCPVCGRAMRPTGKMTAILRGLMANELVASGLRTKHLQLIRLIWTRNGMGEQYYRVLTPDMPYIKFEARVTEILCQGADEGWVTFVLPSSPSSDESTYRLEFQDEARFIAELEKIGTEPE